MSHPWSTGPNTRGSRTIVTSAPQALTAWRPASSPIQVQGGVEGLFHRSAQTPRHSTGRTFLPSRAQVYDWMQQKGWLRHAWPQHLLVAQEPASRGLSEGPRLPPRLGLFSGRPPSPVRAAHSWLRPGWASLMEHKGADQGSWSLGALEPAMATRLC